MMLMFLALMLIDPPAPTAAPHVQKQKMVCRGGEEATGSHMRTGMVCKTEEEWRREDEELARVPSSPALRVTGEQGDALTKRPPPW